MDVDFSLEGIVMQPTTLCNLDCSYCYLAGRDKNLRMSSEVATAVAEAVARMNESVQILWHGGEPLSCGIDHLNDLFAPFRELVVQGKVVHAIQTNATLINERWCKFFNEHKVEVGLSIDGPQDLMAQRVDWAGKESNPKVVRGIECLKANGHTFTVICVVTDASLDRAKELFSFFCNLGCESVGFNIEEKLGTHTSFASDEAGRVTSFWAEMFLQWKQDPSLQVREFSQILRWMEAVCEGGVSSGRLTYDFFPTIGYNGEVALLAPELLGVKSEKYDDFSSGNVLNTPLEDILKRGPQLKYVRDFIEGVRKCSQSCEHFDHCKGGQASNKFFELGTMDGTSTVHCRNGEQRLAKAVVENL